MTTTRFNLEIRNIDPAKDALLIDGINDLLNSAAADGIIDDTNDDSWTWSLASYDDPEECSTCGALYGEMGHFPEPCEWVEA